METITIDVALIKENTNDMDLGALVRSVYLQQLEDAKESNE